MDLSLKILITGAAGYIGSVLVEALAKDDNQLFLLDDLSEGNLQSIPANVPFFKGSYGDAALLQSIFEKNPVDAVIHLAASSSVPDSVLNPLEYYDNNIKNTLILLDQMAKFSVPKFIFSSSAAVYGEPFRIPIDESHPCIPINPYGKSKLFLEEILRDISDTKKLEFVAFRFFCAAGASETKGESRTSETHLIPLVTDCLLGKRDVMNVYGDTFPTNDGSGVRDYIHVEDIAQALVLSLKKFDIAKNSFYNIGSDAGYSVLDIIQAAEGIFETRIPKVICPPRPGDPAKLVASSSKIRNELGWVPKNSIEDIIISAYNWRKSPKY
jgi:UDP-glucose 4-epimerase